MNQLQNVTRAPRDLGWVEELGRANIVLPDGLYVFSPEPASSSARPAERRLRATLRSFLRRWASGIRPRR